MPDVKTYAILHNPGSNRAYFGAARALALHELAVARFALPFVVTHIREAMLGDVPYVLFDCDQEPDEAARRVLSRLSFCYALFAWEGGVLHPLPKAPAYALDEEISAMLKYAGKTNELFTRLMLNLALWHGHTESAPPRVLDPLAGKGTTLFEAVMQGCHAHGVEIDPKPAHEATVYYKKYLETARHKHTTHTERVSGTGPDGKRFTAVREQVILGNGRSAGAPITWEIVAGDTRHVATFFKKNYFDAIVADLPYGVQHGSRAPGAKPKGAAWGSGGAGMTRNAMALLTQALPQWLRVLRPGGTVVLAWNLFLIPREDMEGLLAQHGLAQPPQVQGMDFAHRVDQSIMRDVIIGIKS